MLRWSLFHCHLLTFGLTLVITTFQKFSIAFDPICNVSLTHCHPVFGEYFCCLFPPPFCLLLRKILSFLKVLLATPIRSQLKANVRSCIFDFCSSLSAPPSRTREADLCRGDLSAHTEVALVAGRGRAAEKDVYPKCNTRIGQCCC